MRNTYDNDCKVMIVELFNSGRTVREITEEYGVEPSSIRGWKREFKEKSGSFSKKLELTPEQIELRRLQKELKEITKNSFYHWVKKRNLISSTNEKTLLLTDRILFLFNENRQI